MPIDKYFELFKPGAGGEGGFIRIGMNFSKERGDSATSAPSGPLSPGEQLSVLDYACKWV